MKLSVAIAGAIFLLASLTACIGDRSSEAVDKFIEDAKEDALGTPTPQSGGITAPPGRNAPTEASSGAAGPKIEPTEDSGPTVTPVSQGRIVFQSTKGISVMNADGTELTNLTDHLGNSGRPVWSPDGRRIAFSSFQDGNDEIYVMNADGTELTNISNQHTLDGFPAW